MPHPTRRQTTQRGYGWRHQQIRRCLLFNHNDGDPCPGCSEPMYRDPERNHDRRPLEADHTKNLKHHGPSDADRLLCATCNRTRGAGRDDLLANNQPTPNTTTNPETTTTPIDWSWL